MNQNLGSQLHSVKYFSSLTLATADEISEDVALVRATYVKADLHGEAVIKAEIVVDATIREVIYYQESESDPSLQSRHFSAYSDAPFRLLKAPQSTPEGIMVESVYYTGTGKKSAIIRAWLDKAGDVIREVTLDSTEKTIGQVQYEYDQAKNLARRKEFNEYGELVSDEEFESGES